MTTQSSRKQREVERVIDRMRVRYTSQLNEARESGDQDEIAKAEHLLLMVDEAEQGIHEDQ